MSAASGTEWSYYRGAAVPEGMIMPRDQICISPNDRGFMFADGVYEVIRSYEGRLFRWESHLARLKRSLSEVRIEFNDAAGLGSIAQQLLERNGLQTDDATVYAQITRGSCHRNHCFPDQVVIPTVYMEANRLVPRTAEMKAGVAVITLPDIRWGRCDIKSIGLLPNVLARQAAKERGVFEAIFIRDGIMTEGTHTNVFGVKHGVVMTHTATNRILGGITRDVVVELCRDLSIPVSEQGIKEAPDELRTVNTDCRTQNVPEFLPSTSAGSVESPSHCPSPIHEKGDTRPGDGHFVRLDEMFLAGTTVEVMPVVCVDGTVIGDGKPGPITRRLQVAFRECVTSRG